MDVVLVTLIKALVENPGGVAGSMILLGLLWWSPMVLMLFLVYRKAGVLATDTTQAVRGSTEGLQTEVSHLREGVDRLALSVDTYAKMLAEFSERLTRAETLIEILHSVMTPRMNGGQGGSRSGS